MRVAYVGPLPPTQGGIAQHGHRLTQAMRSEGHLVEVVTWRSQYPGFLYKGKQIRNFDESNRPWLTWWNPLSWRRTRRFLAAFDVAVFPWITPFHAFTVRRLIGAATTSVVVVHNPMPHEWFPFSRGLTWWSLRRADLCIVHGDANELLLRAILPEAPIVQVGMPPTIDVQLTEMPLTPPIRALFLGYIRQYKGLDVALEAVALLASRGLDITLTVAGESWVPVEPLVRLCTDLGIEDRVDFRLGYVPDDEVEALLAAHHLVVAPYRSGTGSAVIPLALAAGRPVATTRVGAIPETVADGVVGALAEPGDVGDFAGAMQRVIDDLETLASNTRDVHTSWQDVSVAITGVARPLRDTDH